MSEYKRNPVTTPKLSGTPLRWFVNALESPLRGPLLGKMLSDSGLEIFRQTSPNEGRPTQVALPNRTAPPQADIPLEEMAEALAQQPPVSAGPYFPETAADFAQAYRRQETNPLEVANRVIRAIKNLGQGDGSLYCFIASSEEDIRAQAQASAQRFADNQPLSLLDGVPLAIKDEMDLAPYPTTVGTQFLGKEPSQEDATLVARLRAAGALLIGKTNMHEVGINPIGINPHFGAARNPYDRGHITGGSSSGSAAAVGAGICPIAIGADGGGSIRIPAALCGVVGLKPTFGRISEHGVYPLCWNVGHVGPLGASVRDVAVAYAFTAGFDPLDAGTREQPLPRLDGLLDMNLTGVRLGIPEGYFKDADADVVKRCEEVVAFLQKRNAKVVRIPEPDLNTVLWTHAILILSEMASSLSPYMREKRDLLGYDTRTNLAIAQQFTATDYVHALRHRHAMTYEYLEIFRDVDVMVTPTSASVAPRMPEEVLPEGQSDLKTTDALMRFARIANITGFPALSVPAGYSSEGLPVGLQFMGRPWEEHLLLRLGHAVETHVERRRPAHSVRLLQKG